MNVSAAHAAQMEKGGAMTHRAAFFVRP